MRSSFIAAVLLATSPVASSAEEVVLRAERLLDGEGGVLTHRDIVIANGSIREIRPAAEERADYDLRGFTVLPGLIDTHVHLDWHFDKSGRLATDASGETPEDVALYAAENAYVMLQAGFTTVQSLGSPVDKAVRDAIARGKLPGPRILTSLGSLSARTGDAAAMRARVREMVDGGADVIKIFASASIRDGGAPTLTLEQLQAACGEATRLGRRSVVHAHGPESARRTVRAGCTTIEHGSLLDTETLQLIAEEGVYFDPNTYLVFQNYFDHQDRYLGIGNYTAEGFDQMRRAVPSVLEVFREGLRVPGLKMVFGTDAVAGAHGRNAAELVYRVRTGGQDAGEAILGATSLAAESLGLEKEIGKLRPGFAADIVAVEGNPLDDVTALERVRFVMRGGRAFRFEP